jgi:hypothetical protein
MDYRKVAIEEKNEHYYCYWRLEQNLNVDIGLWVMRNMNCDVDNDVP